MASDPIQTTALPAWCCPYCGKPVGYLGRAWAWIVGVGIHGCDFALLNRARRKS